MPVIPTSTSANGTAILSSVTLNGTNAVLNGKGDKEDSNRKEIDRLRRTNPVYDTYRPLWDFYLASYEGGESFANATNLFKHSREHPDDFTERCKRIYYHNFCFPLVDFFTTFIFTETIQRESGDGSSKTWYNEFLTNVDRRGTDITKFMSDNCDDMQIFGMKYVLVDSPPQPVQDGPVTQQDEKDFGLRPYWVSIRPDEVLDWVVDDFDKFLYLKRVQTNVTVDPSTMEQQTIETYTEWTPTSIKVSKIDASDPRKPILIPGATVLPNTVGCVPIEVARFKRSKLEKFVGESFLRDLSYISREVMNLTSLLQEFLYRQCFNVLAIEESDNVEEFDQMQGELGTANLLKFPKGASHLPTYISPPVAPAEFLQRERENNINAMFRIAAQDTINELFNGGKASGFSKSQSFQRTVPKIATRADEMEDLEMRLMALTCKIAGKGEWKGTVKYKDHYEVTNLADSLAQMGTLFKDLQIQSKTFATTQLKRMVAEFDGKLTTDQLAAINTEIDGIDFDEWFDTQKLAFIGRAAASPDASLAFGDLPPAPTSGGATGSGAPPVKGKDSPTSPTTAQRPSPNSSTIAAASSKTPKK